MAIEFRCPTCDKKLRTGDDKAGKTAKCPQCGNAVTVPGSSDFAEDDFGGFPSFDDFGSESATLPPRRGTAKTASSQIACGMCGAKNDPQAGRCYACGEDLSTHAGTMSAAPRPGRGEIDLGLALSDGWAVFKDQLGGALALLVVTFIVTVAAMIPVYMLMGGGMVAAMAAAGGPNGQPPLVLFALIQIVFTLVVQLVVWFVSIGFTRALLLLVRQKQLDVGAIFSGGQYYGLMALNSMVVFLITQGPNLLGQIVQTAAGENVALLGAGLVLSLISLGLTAVVYPCIWPYTYIIVDERSGPMSGLGPLRRAWHLTPGSRLISFALFIVLGIINFAGILALCIGVIFTAAYMMVTLTVAYEQLSPRLRHASEQAAAGM